MRTFRAKYILPALLLTATALSAGASATDMVILLSESFEDAPAATGSDTDYQWLPTGWQRIATPGITPCYTWYATGAERGLPSPPDGVCYMAIGYQSTVSQDEWLITPDISEMAAGARLAYQVHYDPTVFYGFKLDNATGEIVYTDELNYTFQVLISTDSGGSWQVLDDLAEDFKGLGYGEAMAYYDEHLSRALQRREIDLSAYAGTTARIAFRYIGRNGASMLLDDIIVTAPSAVNDISATEPTVIGGYDLAGVRIPSISSHHGIYIELLSDGTHRIVKR